MRTTRFTRGAIVMAVCVGGTVGCGGQVGLEATGAVAGAEKAPASIPVSSADPEGAATAVGDTLRHDFGVIRPGQKISHRFAIRNDSQSPWTFQRFHVNCTCTVGQASASAVLPGATEYVEVVFTAPTVNGDQSKRIGVQFAEDVAPFVWLEVTARVRDPVSVLPPLLTFNRVGSGRTVEGTFELYNYEDQDIEITGLTPSEPWVTVKSRAAYRGGAKPEPRQVLRFVVAAATERLSPGRHRADLVIHTQGTSSPPKPLGVEVMVAAAVEAIPERIFFGHVERGRPSENRVLLRVSSDVNLSSPAAVVLSHDLGDQLRLACNRATSPTYWEVVAVLTPRSDAPRTIRGTVNVRFTEGNLPPLVIPVLAGVSEP
jgi:hypothetical protein